jgi:hypothetical protein
VTTSGTFYAFINFGGFVKGKISPPLFSPRSIRLKLLLSSRYAGKRWFGQGRAHIFGQGILKMSENSGKQIGVTDLALFSKVDFSNRFPSRRKHIEKAFANDHQHDD